MDLLAGALDEEARRALDAHLDQCAACTQLVADLADLVEEEPPPEGRDAARVDPDDTPRPRAPRGAPRVGGRYQVLGLLGSGGMGSVYEAFDEALGRKVALKVLRADVVDSELREERSTRLRREARLLAAIHHPNVLSVYDVGTWDGQVFMAVQMVEGSTLGAWIREAAPTWREILEVYLKVGEGLAEAHRQGLVHRDVKPDNILIDATGRAWLADFGLACAIGGDVLISSDEGEGEEALALSAVTRTGVIMGTPAYMAPEQHLGERADDRADQFSFAAALFEGLYGTRAFEGRTRASIRAAVCGGRIKPRPPGVIPKRIYHALRRALAPDPRARYGSMLELLAALEAPQAPPKRPLTLAAALLAVGLSTFIALRATSTTPEPTPVVAAAQAPDAAPSPEARRREELRALEAASDACREDARACGGLVERLRGDISLEYEGVRGDGSGRFKRGCAGLGPRLFERCQGGDALACAPAAYCEVYALHSYGYPEGSAVPRFVEAMRLACVGGDIIGCINIQDTYADGAYKNEGPFSIKPDKARLIEILEAGCAGGAPRACWLIAESLMTSHNLRSPDAEALPYAEQSCAGGWAQACLLVGLMRRARVDAPAALTGPKGARRETCAFELRPLRDRIPENDLFDAAASWADINAFCTRFAPLNDPAEAGAHLEAGCHAPDLDGDPYTQRVQKISKRLSCEARRAQ